MGRYLFISSQLGEHWRWRNKEQQKETVKCTIKKGGAAAA